MIDKQEGRDATRLDEKTINGIIDTCSYDAWCKQAMVELREDLAAKTKECERMRGIVERLPMTANGVRVVPGVDNIFEIIWNDVKQIQVVQMCLCPRDHNSVSHRYSTRSLAEDALVANQTPPA